MSVKRVEVASVQFQIESRQANASMRALEEEAKELNGKITEVKKNIEGLGNVPKDNPQLLAFQNQAKQLKRDLDDVNKTIKDYTRGVKAADELLRNYDRGTIETMSMKAIKAGQNGLKKRIENIDPNKADAEELKAYRIISEVIRESQRVVDDFKVDAEKTIQTIKEGGVVSAKTLRQTRDGLRDLKEGVAEGTKEWQNYQRQLTTVSDKLQALGVEEMRRTGKQTLGRAFRGDFATSDVKTLNDVIAKLREYQSVIEDPEGKGARIFAAADTQIKKLLEQLGKIKGDIASVEQAMQVVGQTDVSVEKMGQAMKVLEDAKLKATDPAKVNEYTTAIDALNQKIKEATSEWMSVADAEKIASTAGTDGFFATQQQMTQAVQAIERQRDALIKTIQQKQRDKQATAEDEAELKRLDKVLKDLKFEQDNFNMSHKQMADLLKQPKSAEDLEQLKAAIKRADGELRRMKQSLGENNKQYMDFAKQVKEAKNVLKEMEGQAKATTSAFDKAWSRLKTYVGLYVGAAVAMQKVTATAGDLMELSDKMGEVRKTTGFTADEVGRLTTELKKLDTRTALTGLMELSSLAGSIGLKTQEQVQGFTEAANMLTVSLPEMGNEASRTLMKIADATGDLEKNGGNVRETLERVGSTIIALRANSAAAAGPITDFVSRVGAVGAQAGISIDQIAALGATVDALGGRVEMSATALSRMIPAIKNNSFAVAQAIGMTEKELKGMTGMEQMVAIFRRLHDSVKDFDMTTEEGMNAAADAVEQMMGKSASMQEVMKTLNQQGARAGIVFGLLSQNVEKLEDMLNLAGKEYQKNTALMDEYNKMNDTAAGKWERLKNQLEEFFVGAGSTSWLADIIDVLRELANWVTDEGPLGRLTRYTIVYLAMMKTGWTQSIGNAALALYEFLFATNKATVATVADTAATTADTAAKAANAAATEAAQAAQGKFNKTMKANVITAVLTAIVALGWAIYDYARKAKEAAKQLDVLADVEKRAREETVKERVELKKLYDATQDQTNSMNERKEALRKMVGDAKYKEYYQNLSNESELAAAAASAYKELSEQILATARARALDAKAEELQGKRLELEMEKADREKWEDENRSAYRQGQQAYKQQQQYVGRVTGGATAGFQESQIAQQGASAMKPAIIDEFESSIKERSRIQGEIDQIDKDIEKLRAQVKAIGATGDNGGGGGGGGGGTNPYGDYNKVTDEYSKWSGNDLVDRRKEMLERVKALANGADVQSVLSEDAKFISEAVRKNIKTTEQAIEWYNTERLKIQDALHAKHLTNTGDWLDPEKVRKRVGRVVQDEMKYYMDELDAYYTERNQEIQRKRNEEEITEGEAWLQTIRNETEWYQRRAELQKLYADKSKEVTQEEQDAIFNIIRERTGETISFIKADIGKTVKLIEAVGEKSKEAMRRIIGDIDLGVEKDALKSAKSVGKSVKFMADTLAKERPLNSIVDDLQTTLTKMGLLEGQVPDKMRVLIGEIENAYSTDVKGLVERISAAGFTEWAKQIEGDVTMQQALIAQLRKAYEAVQETIRKEATRIKKDADMMWKTILLPDGTSLKQMTDDVLARLTQQQDSVGRANSLIGAGVASDNVATKLAIRQLRLQMSIQQAQFALMRKRGDEEARYLDQKARELELAGDLTKAEQVRNDAANVRKGLELAVTEETKKQQELSNQIAKEQEEAQNRLYTELKEWGDLLASSLQSIFEASAAGNEEYYNELAKLNLTGKGGPGAGTYVIIDDAGTSNAKAHYEYLDEREALERQHEIEQENAKAEAWKKVMDDINAKLSETITDQLNAMLQNASIDANTDATLQNTEAIAGLTSAIAGSSGDNAAGAAAAGAGAVMPAGDGALSTAEVQEWTEALSTEPWMVWEQAGVSAMQHVQKTTVDASKTMQTSTQSAFAKMTAAANMYGIAYQAMSNDNLSTSQKFQMMAVQAAGQAAIAMLTTDLAKQTGDNAVMLPGILGKLLGQMPYPAAMATFAIVTGLLGGLMGMAVSKIAKSKSEIAQATGAGGVSAGRLATGMLTYAEGNVNEFSDPASLTPGRQYNVDAADGRTYRARYMGSNPRTHLTNGPEFHLAGEAGREMIIDAGTTRQITMNEAEIWHAIQTLSNGGHGYSRRRSAGRGMRTFAEGNVEEFEDYGTNGPNGTNGTNGAFGMSVDQMLAFQASLDRNSAIMERLAEEGIEAFVSPYGKRGIVNGYDHYKKEAQRQGVKY